MNEMPEWPQVAVVGAGAVGGYFGGQLAHAGAPVVMIGRKPFVEAVNKDGLIIDRPDRQERITSIHATTDIASVRQASLVLFCVKSFDTPGTAKQLAGLLSPDATVVSVQNGVDNVDQIRAAAGIDALAAAVYVAVSVPEPGHIKYLSRGDLILGPATGRTRQAAEIFDRAGIPCRISDNIEGELWLKLLCNCALNAISALGRARYGQIAESADGRQLMERVVEEVMAVAKAARVVLPEVGSDTRLGMAAAIKIATQMAGALSSTAQDLNRGKPTEIDSLNGYISRRGAELGVDVPVNHALFTLVKLAERSRTEV